MINDHGYGKRRQKLQLKATSLPLNGFEALTSGSAVLIIGLHPQSQWQLPASPLQSYHPSLLTSCSLFSKAFSSFLASSLLKNSQTQIVINLNQESCQCGTTAGIWLEGLRHLALGTISTVRKWSLVPRCSLVPTYLLFSLTFLNDIHVLYP